MKLHQHWYYKRSKGCILKVLIVKIPQAKSKTEASLLALGMNAVQPRTITDSSITPAPVMDLDLDSRKMPDNLKTALERQSLASTKVSSSFT